MTSSALRSSSGQAQHTAWGKRRGREEYIELASCLLSISFFLLACLLPYLELLKLENFTYVNFSSWSSLLESPPWRPNMCKPHCVPLTVQANKELPPWWKLNEVTPIAWKCESLSLWFFFQCFPGLKATLKLALVPQLWFVWSDFAVRSQFPDKTL